MRSNILHRFEVLILLLTLTTSINAQLKMSGSSPLMRGESFYYDRESMVRDFDERATPRQTRCMSRVHVKDVPCNWIDRLDGMPDFYRSFYDAYLQAIHAAIEGEENWTVNPRLATPCSEGVYGQFVHEFHAVDTVEVAADATDSIVKAQAAEVARGMEKNICVGIRSFLPYMAVSMLYDGVEGFWLRNSYWWNAWWNYRYSVENGKMAVSLSLYLYYLMQSEENSYDARQVSMRSTANVRSAIAKYKKAITTIVDECYVPNNRYETLLNVNDWLTLHNYYSLYWNSRQNTDMAWSAYSSLTGMGKKDAPVCESYAKAFKVICDHLEIPCITVTGYAKGGVGETGESHMWNEVQMTDGKWYGVDVTWNDPFVNTESKKSGYENRTWFLLGSKDRKINGLYFGESHPFFLCWDMENTYLWEGFNEGSMISEKNYDPQADAMELIEEGLTSQPAYNLQGRYLGNYKNTNELRKFLTTPQIVVFGGKKVFVDSSR